MVGIENDDCVEMLPSDNVVRGSWYEVFRLFDGTVDSLKKIYLLISNTALISDWASIFAMCSGSFHTY